MFPNDTTQQEYSILLVDDEIDNLSLLHRTLRHNHKIYKTVSPLEAIEIVKNNKIDVIISDHKMEEMDGVEFLKRSYEINPECIRLLVTAYSDSQILIDAINYGKVYRYIKKPWEPSELELTVNSAIEYYNLKKENNKLIYDLKDLFMGTINAIIDALEAKDPYSIGRNKKVTFCAKKVAEQMNLTHHEISTLELAGLLHDIGMIGVSEEILNQQEELTPEQNAQFEKHVEYGIKILKDIKQLKDVVEIIKYHHERFDGSGYPYKLKGDDIPLTSSIISICDMYEKLTTSTATKQGLSHEQAVEVIELESNKKYSTALIEAFKIAMNNAKDEYKTIDNQ